GPPSLSWEFSRADLSNRTGDAPMKKKGRTLRLWSLSSMLPRKSDASPEKRELEGASCAGGSLDMVCWSTPRPSEEHCRGHGDAGWLTQNRQRMLPLPAGGRGQVECEALVGRFPQMIGIIVAVLSVLLPLLHLGLSKQPRTRSRVIHLLL